MKRIAVLALTAILSLGVVASADAAKKKRFKTGTYYTSGSLKFKFKVSKGTCWSPVKRRKLRGYCIKAIGKPKARMDCPDVEGAVNDHDTYLPLPYNMYIPKNGRFRVTLGTPRPAKGFDEIKFSVNIGRKGRAKGWVRRTEEKSSRTTTVVCTTGIKRFSAKRRRR